MKYPVPFLALCGTGILVVGLAGTNAHAQDDGPILKSESREVLVDAVAVDKKGKFAQDLTQKDFRIWEDNKEQKVTAFSLESSGVSPERPSKHYIAMFFDGSNAGSAGQMTTRQQAVRFVDGFASPDRYMAVINYSINGGVRIVQNFTTDGDRLKKALAIIPVSQSTGSVPQTNGPTQVVRGGRGGGAGPSIDPSADNTVAHEMLLSLRSLVSSLAAIRGRKAIVFFSGGLSGNADLMSDMTRTIDACNKANVAVYTVSSGSAASLSSTNPATAGVQSGRNPRPVGSLDLETSDQNFIGSLAQGTGGVAFQNTSDLAASLGKVAQEQDQYYLLAYTPAVESAEGSCHDLKVKVDRGDLEVRARKGYCTSRPVDLLAGKPAGRDLETRAASGATGKITAVMQLPWFYSAPNIARVNLAMDLIPASMKFQKVKGKLHGEFNLAGVAYKPDGTVAARVSDTVRLDFDTQAQADAFLQAPYHYENQFEIAPGQYRFTMAIGADGSGPQGSAMQGFGKVEMPLKIEPWNGQTLSESGLALSHSAHAAASLASGLDVSLLEGMRPLQAMGTEVVPTGNNQFRLEERAVFYMEAYEPLLASAKADSLPVLVLRVRVLDRATGQQKADSGLKMASSFMQPGNVTIPIVSILPIAGLPAGAYKLEATVMRQTGEPAVRTTDFDIVN